MTKYEAKKLIKIELDGISNTQSEYDDGWWETSTGAEFGKERLKKVLKIVEALEHPAQEPVAYEPTSQEQSVMHQAMIRSSKLVHKAHPAPSWQGLSVDERYTIIKELSGYDFDADNYDVAVFVEQALRNKNK